jgi:trans-aconitate methyltransferase
MDQRDLVDLIRAAMPAGGGGRWAELGAGEGNFTAALIELLGPDAAIVAVDRDAGALRRLGQRLPGVRAQLADFRQPLGLDGMDGILMANSLHFVRDKRPVLDVVVAALAPGGRLVLVEYGTDRGVPWVPDPMSYPTWERTAAAAGLVGTRKTGELPSRHLGSMYSALSFRPGRP